ncbi:MAG: hypothetical protein ACM3Q1_05860 [Bacteroidales bacterium]
MDRLLSLVPESAYPELELYFLELVAEIRKRRNQMHMSEVCGKSASVEEAYKAIARRVAHLPDEQAISAMMKSVPMPLESRCVAHLQLARKRLKREFRTKRDHQIAALVRNGCSNSDIAAAVGVSPTTAARKAAQAVRGELP